MGTTGSGCVGLEEILTWSSRLWEGRFATDVSGSSVLRQQTWASHEEHGVTPLYRKTSDLEKEEVPRVCLAVCPQECGLSG